MRQIIKGAMQKISKLTPEQISGLFTSMVDDIDRLETVLESLAEGILVCDSEHCLVLANKFSERFLPLSRRGEDPVRIWALVRDDSIAAFLKETLLSGDRADGREFETEAKGIQRLLSISIFPLVKDYHVTGSLIHVDDITEKRRKEARMRQIENLASLTTLAAGVAHEIKNPLGSISIYIQLLQKAFAKNEELYFLSHPEDRPDPNFTVGERGPTAYFVTFHRYMDVINEEIDRLNHIVVDFLFAVRPMNLNLREANINALIRELVEFTAYELQNTHVTTVLELDENLPLLDFDIQLMKQALLNLIQNAAAAMKGGGKLTLRTERKDTEAVISVIDTGAGIPEQNMAKIFEPYFTTKERGSGLGLTLVFKIVREHRGEITAASVEGEGTCFTITLPIFQRGRHLLSAGEEDRHAAVQVRQEYTGRLIPEAL
ncbi:MAG: PAS domain-containing sensor histidine kinase [Spirochaetaceae bacterium]|jgi:signal transduction histidine kinase|nr:PAS domain-containing sensor histidine kinase [Spirochaetaceae bacterium]